MLKRRLRLQEKFILAISFLIVLTSASLSWFFIRSQIEHLKKSLEKRGLTLANNLAYNSEYPVLTNLIFTAELLNNLLDAAMREDDVVYVYVMDENGYILASRGQVALEEIFNKTKAAFRDDMKGTDFFIRHYVSNHGEPICDITTLIKTEHTDGEQKRKYNIGMVKLGISLNSLDKEIKKLTYLAIGLTFIVVTVGILVAVLFVGIIVRPLNELVLGTIKIAVGDWNYKAIINSSDEIGDLANSFNLMVDKLKSYRQEVENYNKMLEHKVEERTKELRDAQAQMIQSAKMAAVGQLGAGIAHEINNPLGGILGYAQFMIEKFKNPGFDADDFKACKKYIETIEKESTRCKKIVANLLKFSRKPMITASEIVDINEAIKDTLSFLSHQLSLRNINLIMDLEANLAKVEGFTSQLQQIFTNLILNASDAMLSGGKLSIITRNIFDEKSASPKVKIEFADTGCGIPEENLTKIFEPFFTTKAKDKGTGLGLSVSYNIIKEHKGDIQVNSQIGYGTTFIIILPIAKIEDKMAGRRV